MSNIDVILERLRMLPLVTYAETGSIPDQIAHLFPPDALTFRAVIDDGERYGKAETYILKDFYDNPESNDVIVENIQKLFAEMAGGKQFTPEVFEPVRVGEPPEPLTLPQRVITE